MSNNESLEQIRARYEADRQRKAAEAREEAEYAEASKLLYDQAGAILKAYGDVKNIEGREGSVPGVYGSGYRVTLHYRETPTVTLPSGGESISLGISEKPHKFSDSKVYYIEGTGLDPADKKQSKKRLFSLGSHSASDWNGRQLSPDLFGHVADLLSDIEVALGADGHKPHDEMVQRLMERL